MPYVLIETLTPVFVGSGKKLQKNLDYVLFPENNIVSIIDEHKIFEIINKHNIDKWIEIIENYKEKDLLKFLKERKSNISYTDISKRIIELNTININNVNFINEHIRNGTNKPYIPGSSIKGSIRTVLFAKYMKENYKDFKNYLSEITNSNNKAQNISDKNFQIKYFSNTLDKKLASNTDFMRFLHTGDAHFNNTKLYLLDIANKINQNKWNKKENKIQQLLECIPAKEKTVATFRFADDIFKKERFNEKKLSDKFKHFKNNEKHISRNLLFTSIKEHTSNLLKNELDFLEKEQDDLLQDYKKIIKEISEQVENCKENECILRIGYGSQFKFITGNWIDYNDAKKILKSKIKENFPFPKTRRFINKTGEPLGFVKLKIIDDKEYQDFVSSQNKEKQKPTIQINLSTNTQKNEPTQITYFTGKLKNGVEVFAELIKINQNNTKFKTFKLFLFEPGKEQEVDLSYFADLPIGTKAIVKVKNIEKDKVKNIEFIKKL